MPEPPPSAAVDPRSGYCASTGVFRSLRPPIPHPPPSLPNAASYILSFISPTSAAAAAYIDAATGAAITFSALPTLVSTLSTSLPITKGQVALILSPTRLEIPALYLALLSSGVVICPVNPSATPSELGRFAALSGATIAFAATSDVAAKLPRHVTTFLLDSPEFQSLIRRPAPVTPLPLILGAPAAEVRSGDTAMIMFSSGTTGAMKGVVLSHGNLVAQLAPFRHIPRRSSGVQMLTAPLFHVYGMVFCLKGVVMEETTVVVTSERRFDARRFVGDVGRLGVTSVALAPPALLAIVRLFESGGGGGVEGGLACLEAVSCGGAPTPAELIRRFTAVFPNIALFQGYGITEATSGVSRSIDMAESSRVGSSGRLNVNLEAKIVDLKTGSPSPPGKRGELCLRGPTIMKGYLCDREATDAAVDAEGWLRTGDLCYFDDDGFLYVEDRLKELIKYKGYQVPPAELENLLQSHPGIAESAVVPYPDEEAGEVPMAFVVRRPRGGIDESGVMEFVNKQVAPYKRIRRVSFISSIPRNPAGKILRKDLVKLVAASTNKDSKPDSTTAMPKL